MALEQRKPPLLGVSWGHRRREEAVHGVASWLGENGADMGRPGHEKNRPLFQQQGLKGGLKGKRGVLLGVWTKTIQLFTGRKGAARWPSSLVGPLQGAKITQVEGGRYLRDKKTHYQNAKKTTPGSSRKERVQNSKPHRGTRVKRFRTATREKMGWLGILRIGGNSGSRLQKVTLCADSSRGRN